jgi:RNA polymerase sigma factor (sigma-70 family)
MAHDRHNIDSVLDGMTDKSNDFMKLTTDAQEREKESVSLKKKAVMGRINNLVTDAVVHNKKSPNGEIWDKMQVSASEDEVVFSAAVVLALIKYMDRIANDKDTRDYLHNKISEPSIRKQIIEAANRLMNKHAKDIIRLRYGERKTTQREIAENLNLNAKKVSQIEREAMIRLADEINPMAL